MPVPFSCIDGVTPEVQAEDTGTREGGRMRAWLAVLVLCSCAHQSAPPTDPFWAEVDRTQPVISIRAEYEAQVRCLSAAIVVVWQCEDGRCQAVFDCPNRPRDVP